MKSSQELEPPSDGQTLKAEPSQEENSISPEQATNSENNNTKSAKKRKRHEVNDDASLSASDTDLSSREKKRRRGYRRKRKTGTKHQLQLLQDQLQKLEDTMVTIASHLEERMDAFEEELSGIIKTTQTHNEAIRMQTKCLIQAAEGAADLAELI